VDGVEPEVVEQGCMCLGPVSVATRHPVCTTAGKESMLTAVRLRANAGYIGCSAAEPAGDRR